MMSALFPRFGYVVRALSCVAALLAVTSAGAAQVAPADELAEKNRALAAAAANRQASATSTNAVIATFAGTTVGGPTYNRGSGCGVLSTVGTATPYNTQSFTVPTSGLYSILGVQNGWDGYLHLYQGTFTPGTPLVNCIASNDDFPVIGQSQILVSLTAGTTYILVTSGFANTDSGTFVNTVSSLVPALVPTLSLTNIALMALAVVMLGVFAQRRRLSSARR